MEKVDNHYPFLKPHFQAGLRSMLTVPLLYRNSVYGSLSLHSENADAYQACDLRMAQNIASQIAGAVANAQLCAELEKAQRSLKEKEELYRDLVENSHDLICIHDLEGRISWINEFPARNLGYERSALLRMNMQEILAPEARDHFPRYIGTIKK